MPITSRTPRLASCVASAVICALLAPVPIHAQRLAAAESGFNQTAPALLYDGADCYLAWLDWSGTYQAIRVQRYNANLHPGWPSGGLRLVPNMQANHGPFMLAAYPAGGIAVAYINDNFNTNTLYLKVVQPSGAMDSGPGALVCGGDHPKHRPQLVFASRTQGSIGYVIWEDWMNHVGDIRIQKLNHRQVAQWGEYGIPVSLSDGSKLSARIEMTPHADVLVCWREREPASDQHHIRIQRLTPDGSRSWGDAGVRVTSSAGNSVEPVLAGDGGSGAVVVWAERRHGKYQIYAQRISAAGERLWGRDGITVSLKGNLERAPTLVRNDRGEYYVFWVERRNCLNIGGQKISAGGKPLWKKSGIRVTDEGYDCYNPRIVTLDGKGVLLQYDSTPQAGRQRSAFVRVNADGKSAEMLWESDDAVSDTIVESSAAPGPAGMVFKATEEARLNLSSVFVTRLFTSNLAGTAIMIAPGQRDMLASEERALRLVELYPNPANPDLSLVYEISAPMNVSVTVYDVRGALVAVLFSGPQPAGLQRIDWDGRNRDGTTVESGVYFCRITADELQVTEKIVILR